MSQFVPPQYHATLDEVLTPTRADVVAAKRIVLGALAARGAASVTDLAIEVFVHEDLPVDLPYRDPVDLPPGKDPAEIVRRDVPQFGRARMHRAVRQALAELDAAGVLLPIADLHAYAAVQVHSGNTTGDYRSRTAPAPAIATAYALPEEARATAPELLDADLYATDIADLLGDRGLRCVDEAFRAHRRGLHLAAVNMLGAASEAAWYALGERLRGRSAALGKALDEDRTVTVFRLVQEVAVQLRIGRSTRETMDELRSHAAYLRDLRNYGLHPRGSVSSDLEHHFTEYAAALLFMNSHRYFKRLAAVAAEVPDDGDAAVGTARATGSAPGGASEPAP